MTIRIETETDHFGAEIKEKWIIQEPEENPSSAMLEINTKDDGLYVGRNAMSTSEVPLSNLPDRVEAELIEELETRVADIESLSDMLSASVRGEHQ